MSLGQINSRSLAGAGSLYTVHVMTADISAPASIAVVLNKVHGFGCSFASVTTFAVDGYVRKRTLPTTVAADTDISTAFSARRAITASILAPSYFYPRAKTVLRAEIISTTAFVPVMADKVFESSIASGAALTITLLRKRHHGASVEAGSTFAVSDEVITRYFTADVTAGASVWAPLKVKYSGDSFWTFDCHADVQATSDFYIQPGWFAGPGGAVFIRAEADIATTLIALRDVTAAISSSATLDVPLKTTLSLSADVTATSGVSTEMTRTAGLKADILTEAGYYSAAIHCFFELSANVCAAGAISAGMKKQRGYTAGIAASATMEATLLNKKTLLANCIDGDTLEAGLKVISLVTADVTSATDLSAFLTVNSEIPAPSYRTVYVGDGGRDITVSKEARTVQVM